MKIERCLACEIHQIYRVAMRFKKEARKLGRIHEAVDRFDKEYGKGNVHANVDSDILILIVDVELDNLQKRTIERETKRIAKLVNSDEIEEGFIEVTDVVEIRDLLPLHLIKIKNCKTTKKKKKGKN